MDEQQLRDELAAFEEGLDEEIPDELAPPPDPTRANAMLSRLRRLQRERQLVATVARERDTTTQAWFGDRVAGIDRASRSLLRALDGFMRGYQQQTKAKSLSLPDGRLTLRAHPVRVTVVDEAAFLEWAKQYPDAGLVRAEPHPVVPEIKRFTKQGPQLDDGVEPTGETTKRWRAVHDDEVVPGVEYRVDPVDIFDAKPAVDETGTEPE